MERPTGMHNRLVALSGVLAFALVVTGVAVVAGSGGEKAKLEKLSFAAGGGSEATSSAMGSRVPSADYPTFGPVEYRVTGDLPELDDKAPAYRLAADASTDDVAKLAAILGVKGEVSDNGGGWSVRSGGQELNVRRGPGLPWFLSTACPDAPDSSVSTNETVASSGCAYAYATPMMPHPAMAGGVAQEAPSTTVLECAPGTNCVYPDHEQPPLPPRDPDLPTRPEAERIARDLASKLEVDVDRLELNDGFQSWQASIESGVGGLPTLGWGTSAAIGPKGKITYASGFLAKPDRIGDYPLVGTAKALERLRAGTGFGPGYLGGPRPLGAVSAPATSVEPATGNTDCSKPTVTCDPPASLTTPPPSPTTVACPPNADCVRPQPYLMPSPGPGPQFSPSNGPDPQLSQPAAGPGPKLSPVPPESVPPRVVAITGVHLALQQVGPALVPVYVFEVEGPGRGFTPPVPAVTDEWIAANVQEQPGIPEGKPLPVPMPAPAPMPTPPTRAVPMGAPSQVDGPPAAGR